MRPLTYALAAFTLVSGLSAGAAHAANNPLPGQLGLRGFTMLALQAGNAPARMPGGAEVLPSHVSRATKIGANGVMPTFRAVTGRNERAFVAGGQPPSSFRSLSSLRPRNVMRSMIPRGVAVYRPGWQANRGTGMMRALPTRAMMGARVAAARSAVLRPFKSISARAGSAWIGRYTGRGRR